MDNVLDRFRNVNWRFAHQDDSALSEIRARIAATGRRRALIRYSQLVAGVTFRIPSIADGDAFQIDTGAWTDLDRALLGDFLGYISLESYERHQFLASAIAVSSSDDTPSEGFWTLTKTIGLVSNPRSDKAMLFWLDQVQTAHNWYCAHPDRDF